MDPIRKYLKNLFAKQRIVGSDSKLTGLAVADALLLSLVNEKKVPGLAITVLKKGEVFFQKGYGYADLKNKIPVDPKKTIFRIASVSKPIAATALAHMVAEGVIELDASFYKYVPYYSKKKWDFTIRQLAGHTAGIRSYKGIEYGLNKPYTIQESIEIFKDDDLLFESGTGYHYNSYDWVLISLAMQEVSSVPFEEYVQGKVLHPLGMIHTFAECHPERNEQDVRLRAVDAQSRPLDCLPDGVVRAGAQGDPTAVFYSKNRKGFRTAIPVNNFYKLAGGGYLSTSEDIAKLGKAYLEGKILKEEVLSQFLTSQTVEGKSTYYGLGWQVSKDSKGRPFYGHVGNGVGGYSNFFVYPEQQMVFSILINCTNPKVQEELDKAVDALIESIKADI